jgi:hypothetical protein
MKITVEISEDDIKKIIVKHLGNVMEGALKPENVIIETKSKQNYKSEWETAEFRVRYEGNI